MSWVVMAVAGTGLGLLVVGALAFLRRARRALAQPLTGGVAAKIIEKRSWPRHAGYFILFQVGKNFIEVYTDSETAGNLVVND